VAAHTTGHDHRGVVPGPSGEASVVLDIGGDRGAAVLFTPEALEGVEIEIRPVGQPWDGTHTAVRRRDVRSSTRYAGVFGSLPGGRYELRVRGETAPVVTMSVTGGTVAQVIWPDPAARPA
jgi:hypothetical protein